MLKFWFIFHALQVRGNPVKEKELIKQLQVFHTNAYAQENFPQFCSQEHVKATTAPYKYPRKIEFVTSLPKTVSGKIRRTELRLKETTEIDA